MNKIVSFFTNTINEDEICPKKWSKNLKTIGV